MNLALRPGTRLGSYEVAAAIGEGGMGQVYRARDTTLNRDVALKVLPDSFAHDRDRLARFTRAAHTLASLNHRIVKNAVFPTRIDPMRGRRSPHRPGVTSRDWDRLTIEAAKRSAVRG